MMKFPLYPRADDLNSSDCRTSWYMSASATVVNSSAECLFPFVYKERVYWGCTTAGHSQSWCATGYHDTISRYVFRYCTRNGFAMATSNFVFNRHYNRRAHEWGPCNPGCPNFHPDDDDVTCRTQNHVMIQIRKKLVV